MACLTEADQASLELSHNLADSRPARRRLTYCPEDRPSPPETPQTCLVSSPGKSKSSAKGQCSQKEHCCPVDEAGTCSYLPTLSFPPVIGRMTRGTRIRQGFAYQESQSLLTIEQSLRRENCSAQALAQGHRGADTLKRDFSLLRGFLIHLFQEGLGRGLD